jgi:hypothetical protein
MVVEVRAARRSEDEKRDRGMAEARAAAGMMGKKEKRKRVGVYKRRYKKGRNGTGTELGKSSPGVPPSLRSSREVWSLVLPAASAGCSTDRQLVWGRVWR